MNHPKSGKKYNKQMEFTKKGKGKLFINSFRLRENQPDRSGNIFIFTNDKPIEYSISGWSKDPRQKTSFINLSFYKKENSGYTIKGNGKLYVNSYKNNPKYPDYSGECTIDGFEYRISGWNIKRLITKSYIDLKIDSQ